MRLNVTMVGDRELIARLSEMQARLRAALVKKVTSLSLRLETKVKGKLSGEVLHVRTGARRNTGGGGGGGYCSQTVTLVGAGPWNHNIGAGGASVVRSTSGATVGNAGVAD